MNCPATCYCQLWRVNLRCDIPEVAKRRLRRALLEHLLNVRFISKRDWEFKHPGPVPPSLLAHMPGLERARVQ